MRFHLFPAVVCLTAQAQVAPSISVHPKSQSVSVGANVVLRVTVSGTPPLRFEWRLDDALLPQAASNVLNIANIQLKQAGNYVAVVVNDFGAATSKVAVIDVDPAFTKITTGPIATEGGNSSGSAWGDFDGDGFIDLFVGNNPARCTLYRNLGDGTFLKLTNAVPAKESGYGCTWGDFDNDGDLDLFLANGSSLSLFVNQGDGTFQKLASPLGTGSTSWSGSWADYNRDGWLDLFVANGGGNNNFLFTNRGDGTFAKVTQGRIVRDGGVSIGAAWGDYDGDGWADLFVANNGGQNFLYRNNADATFTRVLTGQIAADTANSILADWGDYDNDGWLDLAVSTLARDLLYRNLGDGTFLKITNSPVIGASDRSEISQWADYDNDGFLDLFMANDGGENNALYHNNRDGTFTKVTRGSVVNDGGNSAGSAWGDYDNDGFMDLFVANWQGSGPNFLYRNNGNSNHWLRVRCVGAVSNRDGIGAKVRVTARVRGAELQQVREISGGIGFGQSPMLAHFGLGDAESVDRLLIRWPSGTTQEFSNVGVNQQMIVHEPPRLEASRDAVTSKLQLALTGSIATAYRIDSSVDLRTWTAIAVLTNTARVMIVSEGLELNAAMKFYRAAQP